MKHKYVLFKIYVTIVRDKRTDVSCQAFIIMDKLLFEVNYYV